MSASKENKLEVEICLIGVPTDLKNLALAKSIVEQEQFDLVSYDYEVQKVLAKARIRRLTNQASTRFVLYSKEHQALGVQDESVEVPISEEAFKLFRHIRQGAGWWKLRCVFPIKDQSMLPEVLRTPTLQWEVDVYPKDPAFKFEDLLSEDGTYSFPVDAFDDHIKLDLEFPADTAEQIQALKELDALPPLPFEFTDLFIQSEETKVRSRKVFDRWDGYSREHYQFLVRTAKLGEEHVEIEEKEENMPSLESVVSHLRSLTPVGW